MFSLSNRKRKVQVFIDGEVLVLSHFSGIGHYVAALLQAVDQLLYEEKYSHIDIQIGVPWRMINKINRFEFENFSIKRMPTTPRLSNALKKRNYTPPLDLFFGRKIYVFPNYSGWRLAFSNSVPIIYDSSYILHPEYSDDNNRKFLSKQVQLSVDRSSRVITISNNSKKEIVEIFGAIEDKVDVIYPILNTDKFYRRSESEIAEVKAKYCVFGEYILFVGNLEPRKNLVGLLKAYKELRKDLQKKYSLLLVGARGWKDAEITKLILEMRKSGIKVIQPTEYVDDKDLPALYSGATLFTYVSIYEGFGIPPTESMACGTPVISSDNSSLPEAVGNAAEKINAMDIESMTKAIEKMLDGEKLRTEYMDKGYQHIGKFNTHDIAADFLDSLENASR